MINLLIKLAFLAIIVLAGLKFLAPEKFDEVVSIISEKTNLEKDTINDIVDKSTEFATESVDAVKDIAIKKIEEAKDQ